MSNVIMVNFRRALVVLALTSCTSAPPVKELRTPEKAPHVVEAPAVVESPTVVEATPPVVDPAFAPGAPVVPVAPPAPAELVDPPAVVVEATVAEGKPSNHDDPRLAAHKKALGKLSGGKVRVSTKDTWRHRVDKSAADDQREGGRASGIGLGSISAAGRGSGSGSYGGGVSSLRGASVGEASGAGGLGVRGTGAGGSGTGVGTGIGGASGGVAAPTSPAPVVVTKSKIVISEVSVEGKIAKPDGLSSEQTQTPLRAGTTDDNASFLAFLAFVNERTSTSVPEGAMKIDVAGRRFVKVIDAEGKPFPGADVLVRDWKTEKVIATATTYGDGRAPFYPSTSADAPAKWLIEASEGSRAVTATWSRDEGGTELVLRLPRTKKAPNATDAVPLDVLFLIDTTGSMGDEIERIKETLLSMTAKVKSSGGGRAVSLRYGAVLYRDVGDAYVTATRDFTSDVAAFEKSLRSVEADGGGDTPESLNQGLAEAMVGVQWRDGAAKVAFLVADATPHMDYQDDIPYAESLQDAVTLGVRIHAVAASGLAQEEAGSLVFRQIAQYARGRFIFIEYGRDIAASAREHGVDPANVASNNLDDILLREIRREIDGWGV